MKSDDQRSWEDAGTEHDRLNHVLDVALTRYGAVEPGAGLEQRLLSRLRSETRTIPIRAWWRWSAAGALASLLVIACLPAWQSGGPAKTVAQHQPSAPIEILTPPSTSATSSVPGPVRFPSARAAHARPRRSHPLAAVAREPKLDQFPSPRPLSEEELALTRYVKQFPSEAIVVARAQEDFEKELLQQEKDAREGIPADFARQER
jgi:hypothetical protein